MFFPQSDPIIISRLSKHLAFILYTVNLKKTTTAKKFLYQCLKILLLLNKNNNKTITRL